MADESLTLRARNQIADALRAKGIASDCDLDQDDRRVKVTHLPTGSWFTFVYDLHGYGTAWGVTDGPESEWPGRAGGEWEQVLEEIGEWAAEVEYVITEPDFWRELEDSRTVITAVVAIATDNSNFLPSEMDAIANSFEAVKPLIRERYELPEEQFAAIEHKLDELVEASRTMGRKDWLTMVASTGFTLIVSSMIPPSVVQQALGLALRGIAHLFGVDLPSLPVA